MKRTLLGLLVSCIALVGLAAPTPADAWCRCYGGHAYYTAYRPVVTYQPVVAYRPVVAVAPVAVVRPVVAVVRPIVVRPVVAAVAVPVVRVAYRPVYYTAFAYRPAVAAYAYYPGVRRVWYRY